MNIYKVLYVIVLFCVISEGLAWWGGSKDSSSRKDTSSKSSSSSSRSAKPKPEPKKTPEPKPKSSGWFFGKKKQAQPKPQPKPEPKKTTEPKPKSSGKKKEAPKEPKPKPVPEQNPEPKPGLQPKPGLKPKPVVEPEQGTSSGTGWFFGKKKQAQPKPQPEPEPKKTTEPKPKSSGWFFGKKKEAPKEPKPKPVPEQNPEPKPGLQPKPGLKPKPVVEPEQGTSSETDMKSVIERFEGMRLKAYDAQPNNKEVHDTTIGIGFNLNRPDAKSTFEKILPGVDFNKVKSGEQSITEEQARALFDHDVDTIYEPRARIKVGNVVYKTLPSNVKTALVNAVYRGDLGPKTTELIKQGKWKEAGKKYLNNDQYKNADKLGIRGVKIRMDWNKQQFDTMIKEESPKPSQTLSKQPHP